MKLYIITANTWQDGYGCAISIFGAYDSLEKAQNAVLELNKQNDLFYAIDEVILNNMHEIYLGGYIE